MKVISFVLHSCAALAVLLTAAARTQAADDFMAACMSGAKAGTDAARTCACMSTRIPADLRADAAEALRRSDRMNNTAKPVDPSTLPPNLMKGLQAAVLAQADCR